MRISDNELKKGVRLCFSNANRLIEDAEILLKRGSYGHSLFLSLSAIEEVSKAFMSALSRIKPLEFIELDNDIFIHDPKLMFFICSLIFNAVEDASKRVIGAEQKKPVKPLDVDDFVEMGKDLDSARKDLWNYRLRSLYVDYKEGKWLSPLDIKRKDAELCIDYAVKYKKSIEHQCKGILNSPLDLARTVAKLVDEYLHDQGPHLVEYLHKNKLISERLYRKMRARVQS